MFKQSDLPNFPKFSSTEAKKHFIRILQDAHAGELAAAYAYHGHGYSFFVRDKKEKQEILTIRDEEYHHRARLKAMLVAMGSKPRPLRELLMRCIGFSIGVFCLFGGWFIPMYGAGKLESGNVFEYEVAARLALLSGHDGLVEELLEFGELEWDHELYFRSKSMTHFLHKWVPFWAKLKTREKIRSDFRTWST